MWAGGCGWAVAYVGRGGDGDADGGGSEDANGAGGNA